MAKRKSRRGTERFPNEPIAPPTLGLEGGRYQPLSIADMRQLDEGIRHILSDIGFAAAPSVVTESVLAHGGQLSPDGRLLIPETLLEKAVLGLERDFSLFGLDARHELKLSAKHVHVGSGGAAPYVVDMATGRYRESTLNDLYDAARLVDALDNIHFFSRSLVARDLPDALSLDVNTAYACLAGTAKHVCTSVSLAGHVEHIADMCFIIAGSKEAFIEKPFLSLNINHVVPPLRLDQDACEVMAEAARIGIPIHANAFGQLGASSPVSFAGSIIQNMAEALAGMVFAWLINPKAKVILGSRPMITDLRTGAMSGGSGEQALIMAATSQMAQYYNLPNSCIAGATDSKIPDAQSGYEKSLTVTLAAHAGSNMITQSCGMHAGLMAVAFESYLIDNDMLGGILRSLSPVDIHSRTLATDTIRDVVRGEEHFLGHPETYRRMKTDFLYPNLADRRSPQAWTVSGAKDIREVAKEQTKVLLNTYVPSHVEEDIDNSLTKRFNIFLERKKL